MVGDNFTHDIQGALDVGIDGVWLNWTDKPKPVGELSYTEVSTFEQAAARIALCSDKFRGGQEKTCSILTTSRTAYVR